MKRIIWLIFTAVYCFIGAVYVSPSDWIPGGILVTVKSAPILLLAAWMFTHPVKRGWLIGAGLLFSAAGDIALDTHSLGFILGMIFFALAHIAYISCFIADMRYKHSRLVFLAAFLVCIGMLIRHLSQSDGLTEPLLRWMVFGYTGILSLMVVTAFFHNTRSMIIASGAVIFAISDSMIAWNRFINPIVNSGMLIMFTYYLAQYLIVYGYSKSKDKTADDSTEFPGVIQ
ncbi:MAG: lysoplasmalogenase [Armatimonadota bacterium]